MVQKNELIHNRRNTLLVREDEKSHSEDGAVGNAGPQAEAETG